MSENSRQTTIVSYKLRGLFNGMRVQTQTTILSSHLTEPKSLQKLWARSTGLRKRYVVNAAKRFRFMLLPPSYPILKAGQYLLGQPIILCNSDKIGAFNNTANIASDFLGDTSVDEGHAHKRRLGKCNVAGRGRHQEERPCGEERCDHIHGHW